MLTSTYRGVLPPIQCIIAFTWITLKCSNTQYVREKGKMTDPRGSSSVMLHLVLIINLPVKD